jgi:hypothetical protein
MRYIVKSFLLALGLSSAVGADEGYRDGRVLYLESGVVLQRATEAGSEEATVNLPLLPGDRVWTDSTGRADFQFPDGTRLRLDSRSKIDYVAHDESGHEQVVLRLWSGGVYLHVRGEAASYELETPGGLVTVQDQGLVRIDVEGRETRLTVYEGEALLESGDRRVKVARGERTYARQGESPERAQAFEDEGDDFARWNEDRERRDAWASTSRRYLPDELDAYAGELDVHGTWYHEAEVGHVWRPYVTAGWRPYGQGRWTWTAFGWTWVPNESWGWAPFHYGRWGHSVALGWYWIPGRTWGPGWVSWAVGGDHVGWCALGRHDRPIFPPRHHEHDRAVPRGSRSAWSFVRRHDLGNRDVARRRVDDDALGRDLRIAESPRLRPTRDVRELREADVAVRRPVRTRFGPGDTVPELQRDNQTQLGSGPRRGRVPRQGDWPFYEQRRNADDAPDRAAARPGQEGQPAAVETGTAGSGAGSAAAADAVRARPTDRRSPRAGYSPPSRGEAAATPSGDPGRAEAGATASEDGRDRARSRRERTAEPDQDVLRRLFRPLSEPRATREGEEDRRRERDEASGARTRDRRSRDGGTPDGGYRPPPPTSREPRAERPEPRSEPRSWTPRPPREENRAPRDGGASREGGRSPRAEPRSSEERSSGERSSGGRAAPRPRHDRP